MENNKTNLEIEEQNESVPEDEKLVPQEQRALTVKKQKNVGDNVQNGNWITVQ